ncbi:ABC transporter permease [Amycolatopsis suaedae]|uniref:Transport permease protein n=1 Tax=Amycolatopsis suaedae TaxID=2510978 RepID=A0A4Q7J4C0_9PSEU|nr:ABC transporter permease [Amycolatopsis suaedae]RZQ61658.1 ABC transporter permease [Amycolatopsis suaedae]
MTTLTVAPARTVGTAAALRHGLSLTRRGLIKMRKNPEQLADVTIMPIVMLAVFSTLFGGAIYGSVDNYLQVLVPGMMVQNTIMASISAGVNLNTDASKGVFDRFRSMPIARSAPLVGAVFADVARYLVALTVLLAFAMVLGFDVHTGVLSMVVLFALLVVFGLAFCWIAVWVGMLVSSPGATQGILMAVMMPLTMASDVFVPAASLPDWLRGWVEISPVSQLAGLARALSTGGEIGGPLLGSVLWAGAVFVVFFPLAVRAYLRRSR